MAEQSDSALFLGSLLSPGGDVEASLAEARERLERCASLLAHEQEPPAWDQLPVRCAARAAARLVRPLW
jgi:hypothetical protein